MYKGSPSLYRLADSRKFVGSLMMNLILKYGYMRIQGVPSEIDYTTSNLEDFELFPGLGLHAV